MSASEQSADTEAGIEATIDGCRPARVDSIVVHGADLESTAPGHLRDVKAGLVARGLQPATLRVTACFTDDCTLSTQSEADRLRDYIRAASFLGAGRLEVRLERIADAETVDPALAALAERARREGVELIRQESPNTDGTA